MENKQNENIQYVFKSTVIEEKLELQLSYERSKHIYTGLYDAELLKTCGFPANMCTDLHNVSNFLMSAKYGVYGIQFLIKTEESRQTASIAVVQEIGTCRILDINLRLEQKLRDRFDILEEEIKYLISKNQQLKLWLKDQDVTLKSAKTENETLTERVNKLEQVMLKLTKDLEIEKALKRELKNQVAENVKDIKMQIEHAMPKGSIVLWSGSIDDIPEGWRLCDGSDGAPDLRNRFVVGAGGELGTNVMGGSDQHEHKVEVADHTLTLKEIPINRVSRFFCQQGFYGQLFITSAANGHNHDASCMRASHLPPYYALCFIVKVM